MPARPLRRTPRATASMVELLHRIADQGEHVRDWEVTRQPDGVLLRVKSRESYGTEAAAEAAAPGLCDLVLPPGYESVSPPVTSSRPEDVRGDPSWRACAELLVVRRPPRGSLRSGPSTPED